MTTASLRDGWQPAVAPSCVSCRQHNGCLLASLLPDEATKCSGIIRRRYPLARDARLYRRGARFTSVYLVCAGSIKTQRETPEGDLIVTGFYLPGDIVGLDAIADSAFPCDAIATTASEVCQLDFERLLTNCASRPRLHEWMMSRIASCLRRKDNDLCWSTGLTADRRVLRFFVDLLERLDEAASRDDLGHCLPMRKQDIARYLRITPETLSRNLAQLRTQGLLRLNRDRFHLPDTRLARQLTRF